MAPVLTRLFTSLFTILLLGFLVTMAWTGNPINVEREVLIGFDLLLAVVVGLVLSRPPRATRKHRRTFSTACNCCSW